MRARIVEINEFTLVLKDERKRFLNVDKDRLKFDYQLGDTVEVEKGKNGQYTFRVYGGNEPLTGSAFPLRSSVKNINDEKRKVRPEPIRGGLLAILIASVAVLVWQIYAIATFHVLVDNSVCAVLNTYNNGACTPYSVLRLVELTMMIILAMLNIAGIVAVIARRRLARRIISITCVTAVVWIAIDWLSYGAIDLIHSLPDSIITTVDLNLIGWLIVMAATSSIIIPYLYKSDNVRRILNKK